MRAAHVHLKDGLCTQVLSPHIHQPVDKEVRACKRFKGVPVDLKFYVQAQHGHALPQARYSLSGERDKARLTATLATVGSACWIIGGLRQLQHAVQIFERRGCGPTLGDEAQQGKLPRFFARRYDPR